MDGQRIKKLREAANISQLNLAKELGVSKRTVSRWERDICQPSPLAKKRLQEFIEEVYK